MEKIYILGAGVSGIYSKLTNRNSMIIDRSDEIMLNSRLINIVSNDENALLKRKVDIKDEVLDIDFGNRLIKTKGKTYSYDKIIVALGSSQSIIPGTLSFNNLDSVYKIRDISKQAKRICIIGGGYLGVELAGIFKEKSILISPKIIERNEKAGGYIEKILTNLGVSIIKDRVNEYKDKKVILKNSEIECDLAIYAGGVTGNSLISKLNIKNKRSSIIVDRYLKSVEYDDVYACGSSAYFDTPMTVYNAMRSGITAMKNLMGNNIEYRPDERNIVNINNKFYIITNKKISGSIASPFIKIIKNARATSTDKAIEKINSIINNSK